MRHSLQQNALRTILLLILVFISPRVVDACGCYPKTTVLDDYDAADLVIIARLKAVTKGPNRFGGDITHATMVVEKVFKGDVKIGEELTFGQGHAIVDCSWEFYADEIGETNLLYLYRPEKSSEPFYVSTCNRSNSVENAKDDLLYLENIDNVRGRTRISGVVKREGGDDESDAGQQVRIVGKSKTYIATTNQDGVYEVYNLPPGRYSLEPVLKPGWKVDEFRLTRPQTRAEWRRVNLDLPPASKVWFTLHARKHFSANIRLRLANRITGRVITPGGQPLNWVCVSLVSIPDSGSYACNALTEADGTFVIQSVNAGSYQLLINYTNIRSSFQPFPKLYYPAVASAAAKVFTVKFGESIEGLNFVVPTLYETVKLEGIVRYSNGRPASNRYVAFKTPKTSDVDGNINVTTDKGGRFSLTVLKGLRGELFSTYVPDDHEFVKCSRLKRSLEQSGKRFFESQHLDVEANENKTFELKLPASPCR